MTSEKKYRRTSEGDERSENRTRTKEKKKKKMQKCLAVFVLSCLQGRTFVQKTKALPHPFDIFSKKGRLEKSTQATPGQSIHRPPNLAPTHQKLFQC
jgi:hypothetical protein